MAELRKLGWAWEKIAREVDRPGYSVRDRVFRLANRPKPKAFKVRPCITCRDNFKSEGFHNRMCNPCRAHTSTCSPFDVGVSDASGRSAGGGGASEIRQYSAVDNRRVHESR